ncbi:MAG: hypothetical protein LBC53_04250 [Spirochaetaceae bacterium]|jgi:hypothetical protein|nr:hypothetical protein [Spirochaetaceae bacterium]
MTGRRRFPPGEYSSLFRKRLLPYAFLCFCFFNFSPADSYAQTSSASAAQSKEIKKETPQWLKDFRRGEIVAFGSFPFAWFLTTLFVDLSRSAAHDWDSLYWPWPAKPAGAVELSSQEYKITLSIAAALALTVALTDHLIIKNKRAYERQRKERSPPAQAVIERRSIFPAQETGDEENAGVEKPPENEAENADATQNRTDNGEKKSAGKKETAAR